MASAAIAGHQSGVGRSEATYTFASQPRALQPQRRKYRGSGGGGGGAEANGYQSIMGGDGNQVFYGNIMFDKRVVRGNSYAKHATSIGAPADPVDVQRQKEKGRREVVRKRARHLQRVRSPEPIDGRKHVEMQTEIYLEELSDRVEDAEVECQTDAFLDRPPSPMFVPAKSGVDKETQILDGELFDFDIEVLPVLEVLIGKTVEQALLEVMEEEELADLREQQREFEEVRNAELMEQQRLEDQGRRHREEKERRMKQQEEMARNEKETAARLAAHAFAQSYLADLVPSVFGILTENGYFYDPVERELERSFLPWLLDCIDDQLTSVMRSRRLLDSLLQQIVARRRGQFIDLENRPKDATPTPPLTSERPDRNSPTAAEEEETVSAEGEPGNEGQSEGQEFANEVSADADHISEEEEGQDD